jgi:Holliday junction resolvase
MNYNNDVMTSPSKRKGVNYERELVNEARARGLDAERAYASDGRALGESSQVDLVVQGMRLQAKRRKKLASYLHVPYGADGVVFREDHGATYVLIKWHDLLDKLEDGW